MRKIDKQLRRAAKTGDILKTHKVIDAGADVNTKDSAFGQSPLHQAQDSEIIKVLTCSGADVHAMDFKVRSPFFYSVMRRDIKCVIFFIKSGTNVNAKDEWGRTPLDWAKRDLDRAKTPVERAKILEIIKALLDAGADDNTRDKGG